jgi:PPOX class probable F420-dependent enzyme
MGVELSPLAIAFLAEPVLAHVATLMKDGSPQVTPVWVETDGADILINSSEPRLKTQNMLRDGRVALSIMGLESSRKNLFVRGWVKEITAEGAIDQINGLSLKYTGKAEYGGFREGETRMLIRIEPLRVRERGLDRA